MLAQAALFAGAGYYRAGSGFTRHAADFDFDFLPLRDNYHPPAGRMRAPLPRRSASRRCSTGGSGCSTTPRPARRCAAAAGASCGTCSRKRRKSSPPIPATCSATWARTPGTGHSTCGTSRARTSRCTPVSSADLEDERWTLRAWHADRWLRAHAALLRRQGHRRGAAGPVGVRRSQRGAPGRNRNRQRQPARRSWATAAWRTASRAATRTSGASTTGCASAAAARWSPTCATWTASRCPGGPDSSPPAPGDLSDLLLLDVEAGLREKASRIEEAITAVQSFIRRAPARPRAGLDGDPRVRPAVGQPVRHLPRSGSGAGAGSSTGRTGSSGTSWPRRAASRRSGSSSRSCATSTLTLAAPGGLDWWPDDGTALERAPELLQRRVPSELTALPPSPPATSTGRHPAGHPRRTHHARPPEYAAQPTWLAAVPQPAATGRSGEPDRLRRIRLAGRPGRARRTGQPRRDRSGDVGTQVATGP